MNAHFYAKLVANGFSLNGFMLFVESIVDTHGEDYPIQHRDEFGLASWENCAIGLYIKSLGVEIGTNALSEFLDIQLGTAISEYVGSDTIKTYGELLQEIYRYNTELS